MTASPYVPSDGLHALPPASAETKVCLRSYRANDRPEVLRLYRHGRLAGAPDPLDPAIDLEQIEDVYLKRPQDHFWVAHADSDILGTIAMTEDDKQIAHVRRLRVDPAWKVWRGGEVARALIRTATHHARQHDSLKLVFHTAVDDDQAIVLLRELGFEFARTRELRGRHLLEFYLNLYMRPPRPGQAGKSHGGIVGHFDANGS